MPYLEVLNILTEHNCPMRGLTIQIMEVVPSWQRFSNELHRYGLYFRLLLKHSAALLNCSDFLKKKSVQNTALWQIFKATFKSMGKYWQTWSSCIQNLFRVWKENKPAYSTQKCQTITCGRTKFRCYGLQRFAIGQTSSCKSHFSFGKSKQVKITNKMKWHIFYEINNSMLWFCSSSSIDH